MEHLLWAIGGAIYALVGARVAFMTWRVEKRIGREDKFFVFWSLILWPFLVVVVGLIVVLTDELGIYAPNYRHVEKDTQLPT